jgi:hypothetical protein
MKPNEENSTSEEGKNKKKGYDIYDPKQHKFGPFTYALSSFTISAVVMTSKLVLQVMNSTKVCFKFITQHSSLEKKNSMKF